jgi:hypothetical protein
VHRTTNDSDLKVGSAGILDVLWKAVIVWVMSCGGALAETDEHVLQRYRASEGYGSVQIVAATENVAMLRSVEEYARSRGIHLVTDGEPHSANTRIELSAGSDGVSLEATRYQGERQIDQLRSVTGDVDGAQLIVDELLLLWHPSDSNSTRRSWVMDYALRPTSYEVQRRSMFRQEAGLMNQRWHRLSSRTPTFAWESFPRKIDLTGGATVQDFRHVSYQFRITPPIDVANGSSWVHAEDESSSTIADLTEPSITIHEFLKPCERYIWTARAVFELNGVPRQTEWAGFHAKNFRPWYVRRSLKRFGAIKINPSTYHFAVQAPKSPFAEACVE